MLFVLVDLMLDPYTRSLQLQYWTTRSFHPEQGHGERSTFHPLSSIAVMTRVIDLIESLGSGTVDQTRERIIQNAVVLLYNLN